MFYEMEKYISSPAGSYGASIENEMKKKKREYLKDFTLNFYNKVKDKPNVLNSEYLYSRRNKLFNNTIWDNQSFLISRNIIFGLKSGICFEQSEYYFAIHFAIRGDYSWTIHPAYNKPNLKYNENWIGNMIVSEGTWRKKKITEDDYQILIEFFKELDILATKFDQDLENEQAQKMEAKKQSEIEETERLEREKEQLKESKQLFIQKLDTDNNGEIDLIDNDFPKLLSKYQKDIIAIDKSYIHQFVKVSNYISTKKNNIQQIFKSIDKSNSKSDLDKIAELIQGQVYTYNLLVFHSLNMIEALVGSEDLITFYEIYEKFDKIGIYNSNWENEVSSKLTSIGSNISSLGNKLDSLLNAIAKMEKSIVSEISDMNYSVQESFGELNNSLSASLKSINSSIDVNNLFTVINTYQLYKINKHTKSLLPPN